MKIGLYFGSFNPIHIGHMIIADFVQQNTDVQKVWFVVSPQNPFKTKSSLLNAYHRLHLVKLAIADNLSLEASDVEFNLPTPSYTIDTLLYLEDKYPQHQFCVILGSDSFQNIQNWKNGEQLIKKCPFIIYNRAGFSITVFYNADYQVVNAPLLQISSTYIRTQIKSGKSIRYLLPEAVFKEIMENRYYL